MHRVGAVRDALSPQQWRWDAGCLRRAIARCAMRSPRAPVVPPVVDRNQGKTEWLVNAMCAGACFDDKVSLRQCDVLRDDSSMSLHVGRGAVDDSSVT